VKDGVEMDAIRGVLVARSDAGHGVGGTGGSGPAFAGALGWRGDGWGRASAPATTRHHDLDLCVLQNTAFDAGR
jgi:hypothetical protein